MNIVLSVMFNNNKKCTLLICIIIQSVSIILIESGLHIQKLGTPQTDLVFGLRPFKVKI